MSNNSEGLPLSSEAAQERFSATELNDEDAASWASEVLDRFEEQDDDNESRQRKEIDPPAADGMKPEPLDLYEGLRRCECCTNWVKERPYDVKKSLEATDEVRQYAVLVKRKQLHRRGDSLEPLDIDSVVVHSPLIKKSLLHIFKDYPDVTINLAEDTIFRTPFAPFFFKWNAFEEAIRTEGESDTAIHLKTLHNILAPELEESLRLSKDLASRNLINFDLLWTLFKPGDLIYFPVLKGVKSRDVIHSPVSKGGEEALWELQSWSYVTTKFGLGPGFELNCRIVDWDGWSFGYEKRIILIRHFEKTQSIRELPAYPLKEHESPDTLRAGCLQRGRRFEELAGMQHAAYRGMAYHRRKNEDLRDYTSESLIDEHIIIDAERFFRNSTEKIYLKSLTNTGSLQPQHDKDSNPNNDSQEAKEKVPLTDDQCLICPPWVQGYALKSKEWTSVLVRNVRDISWNGDAFKHLVLPQGFKDLILGFVQDQLSKVEPVDDVPEVKDHGMILLLSGPTGVGKTLTAEAVAAELHAPLYSINAGNLGFDESSVEEHMLEILELTKRWNAVLLIDEADIFLEQRSINDLDRSMFVSVLQRTLEYFDGVLFLTTNRLSNLDHAFESRIDFNIEYPELDSDGRLQIWKNLFMRMKRPVEISDSDFKKLAQMELNGRRIKNTIKSAQLIAAREKDSAIKMKHVETVLSVVSTKSVQ